MSRPKVVVNEYKSLAEELRAIAAGIFAQGRQSHDWAVDAQEELEKNILPNARFSIEDAISRWNNKQNDYLVRDLPKVIYAETRAQYLSYGQLDDDWYVSYAAATPWPNKKVFIHYDETTLERAVLKTYRYLALHKNDWETFTEEPTK